MESAMHYQNIRNILRCQKTIPSQQKEAKITEKEKNYRIKKEAQNRIPGLLGYDCPALPRTKKIHSYSAKDFLQRLSYLLDGKFDNLQTDNGSEFLKHFETACAKLKVPHYFSRTRTPKDNSECERFNRTLQEEFIAMGNMTEDIDLFNRNLTDWLIEYNFNRPHQTLNYLTPIEFTQKYAKVSKMYSSNTPI